MQLEAVVANTLRDRHGDRMTKEALEHLATSVKQSYIPVGIEHDPRVPPQGRMVDAWLRERPDGEYEVVAILEVFDEETDLAIDNQRELVLGRVRSDDICIHYDRTYENSEDQKIIGAINERFGSEATKEFKKATEPLSVLWIVTTVALSAFATRFFGKAGSDAYDYLREKLSELMERRSRDSDEYLLVFGFTIHRDDETMVEINVGLENPNQEVINNFLDHGIYDLEKVLPKYVESAEELRKLFFSYSEPGSLTLEYAVRKDCIPLKFNRTTDELLKSNKP